MNTQTVIPITSNSSENGFRISTIPGHRQAPGAFDSGKITERKPIAMPHDRAPQKSIGPLFYWAWAQSDQQGVIGLHPHQGFEILSYVLQGKLNHRDTLGNQSRVGVGGAQVQQAGSGLSHEEITGPDHTEFFQIWFQPDLEAALKRAPSYGEFEHESFPTEVSDDVSTKTILGPDSPIQLVTEASMRDINVAPGGIFVHPVTPGRALVMVTVEGGGRWSSGSESSLGFVSAQDCTVITPTHDADSRQITLTAEGGQPLRFVAIEAPLETAYPLYR